MSDDTFHDMLVLSIYTVDGKVMAYDSQGGAFPISYDRAKELRDYLNQYLKHGKSNVDKWHHDFLEDLFKEDRNRKPQSPKPPKDESGYVYLLKSENGHYKIGKAKNPDNRLKTFTVKLPFKVEYICTIQTVDMGELEAALHEQYETKRIDGEWFNLEPEDIEYIKGMAS